MSSLYNRLHFGHFSKGWSIYWRLSLPFWLFLGFLLGVFSFVVFLPIDWALEKLIPLVPALERWPFVVSGFLGLAVLLAGFPFLRMLQRAVSRRFESDYYRSQFGIFGSLDKFNKGLLSLFVAVVFLIMVQWRQLSDALAHLWLWIFLMAVLLAGIVGIFIAFYGWLGDQLDDVKTQAG